MSLPVDVKLNALVEIEDIIRRLYVLKHDLAQDIARDEQRFQEFMQEARRQEALEKLADEALREVAPDYEAITHCAAIPEDFAEEIDACGE